MKNGRSENKANHPKPVNLILPYFLPPPLSPTPRATMRTALVISSGTPRRLAGRRQPRTSLGSMSGSSYAMSPSPKSAGGTPLPRQKSYLGCFQARALQAYAEDQGKTSIPSQTKAH